VVDRSDDGSLQWLQDATQGRPWLQTVAYPEAPTEYLGAHIARLKRFALEQVMERSDDRGDGTRFAGVLDADVELPVDHYARLMEAFEKDAKLGVVSSLLQVEQDGERRNEPFQRGDLPRGPTQFFRRACLDNIGGLPPFPGFDGAANVKAQMRGWRTQLLPHVKALHRRPTATRFGEAPGFARKGRYAWYLGVHPLLVAARTLAYTRKAPHTAGYHFLRGWLQDAAKGVERCPDPDVRMGYGSRRLWQAARAFLGRGYQR